MMKRHIPIMFMVAAVLVSTEAFAEAGLGVEIGGAARVHSFAPNARRPVALGGEVQLLARLSKKWHFRVGGGHGYGGRKLNGSLQASWLSASLYWQISPHWSLSYGLEHEQRYESLSQEAETYHYGGFIEGRAYFLKEKNVSFYIGYRPVMGAFTAEIDLLDDKSWYFSTINSFTFGAIYLP